MAAWTLRTRAVRWPGIAFLLFSLLLLHGGSAWGNPADPSVVAGQATFDTAGPTLNITTGDRTIIDWGSFSIGAGELTRFIQPGVSSAVLNRVTGGSVSEIFGALQSNGQVFLVNPNGVYISPTARIDVGGFMATTLDINNAQFMHGGDLEFSGMSNASIVNHGAIRAIEGNVYLVADRVENYGTIQATGYAGLVAAQSVKLIDGARPYLVVTVNSSTTGSSTGGVKNAGLIEATQAELIAAHGNVYALAINNTGVVRANGVEIDGDDIKLVANGGRIVHKGDLIAAKSDGSGGNITVDAGAGGSVEIGGTIDAAAEATVLAAIGGRVQITGDQVQLTGATIDASGPAGGGSVLVGGDFQGANPLVRNAAHTSVDIDSILRADATASGNGGRVIVWADESATSHANITARGGPNGGNGGLVEVSGKQWLTFAGMVDTSAAAGNTGTLQLDPTNFSINAGAGPWTANSIGVDVLMSQLLANHVTLQTAATGAENGDIFVNASFTWNHNTNGLSLVAHRNINFADGVTVAYSGDASLLLRADSDANGTGTVVFNGSSMVNFTGGAGNVDILYNPASYSSPTDFSSDVIMGTGTLFAGMLVNNLSDLQAVNNNRTGSYALGANIDASPTTNWNSGAGFVPLGNNSNTFRGIFDGRGHTIDGLFINRPTTDAIGLFGYVQGATIRNVGLTNVDVIGRVLVGGLVGIDAADSNISQSYVVGIVEGQTLVGGLVGRQFSGGLITQSHSAGTVNGQSSAGGLLGESRGGRIEDSYSNANVSATEFNAGGLVGGMSGGASVVRSYATGTVIGGSESGSGGLIARINVGSVSESYATGNVSGKDYVGGLVGYMDDATITRSYAAGTVTASEDWAGGLVGRSGRSNITQSYATGDVTALEDYVGGLVGLSEESSVTQSYATGDAVGRELVGGLVGYNYLLATIEQSYATGSANGANFVGGLAGFNASSGSVAESYSTGQVSGPGSSVRGLLGGSNGTVTNSFWDVQTSGKSISAGGAGAVGLTTAQMKTQFTFATAGWDFTNVWHMAQGVTYPVFQSQGLPSGFEVGGNAFADLGVTPAGSHLMLTLLINGNRLGSVVTDNNGYYSFWAPVADNDALLVYLDNNVGQFGGTVWLSDGLATSSLDVFIGALQGTASGVGGVVDAGLFADALGSHVDADVPYAIGSLVLDPGIAFVLPAGNTLVLNDDIFTNGADILLNGSTTVAGPATLNSGNDLIVNGAFNWTTADSLSLRAARHVQFNNSVQNRFGSAAGHGGAFNIVAGWDGTTGLADPFDFSLVLANETSYGNNGGSVFIGNGSQTAGIAVGSRFGATNLAAQDLSLTGSTVSGAFAQLGYRVDSSVANFAIDSPIQVALNGNLSAMAGSATGTYAHVGHGGRDTVMGTEPDGNFAGAITIDVVGSLALSGGGGAQAYAQLGHGGYDHDGTRSGVIGVTAGTVVLTGGTGSGTSSYAQLGHGGSSSAGTSLDNITLTSPGNVTMTAGTNTANFVRIGHGSHGGPSESSTQSGDIFLDILDLTLTAGAGANAIAQVGHGGLVPGGNTSGNIAVLARDVSIRGASGTISFAQIGHVVSANVEMSGNISLDATGNLVLAAGTNGSGDARIGHGRISSGGNRSGHIDLRIVGESSLVNATGIWAIGHATGSGSITNANVTFLTGTLDFTTVSTTTLVDITGTVGANFASRMISNLAGGDVTIGALNTTSGSTGGMLIGSAFNYSSANDLSFVSTRDIRFYESVQNSFGTAAGQGGQVNVVAGWDGVTGIASPLVMVEIFNDDTSYGNNAGSVFIGNGSQSSGVAVGSRFGQTNLAANNLTLTAGSGGTSRHAQLGYRVNSSLADFAINSPITVALQGDLTATGSTMTGTYAQIGNGGRDTSTGTEPDGDFAGAITIDMLGNLTLTAGTGTLSYSQIGHGGYDHDGARSGAIMVSAGAIALDGGLGSATSSYTQIGHGGSSSAGTSTGNIDVVVTGDAVLTAGESTATYARIGHGAHGPDLSSYSGNILVDVRDLILAAGSGGNAVAHIGHGGLSSASGAAGSIAVFARDISMTGSTGSASFAQIGHATTSSTDLSGGIDVSATGNLTMLGSSTAGGDARIGHGRITGGTRSGDIDVRVAGETSLVNVVGIWAIGHVSGSNAVSNANVTFITNTLDYDAANVTPAMQTLLNQNFADKFVANMTGGHVTVGSTNPNAGGTGGMLVTGAFNYDNANNLSFVSSADVLFQAGVQNSAVTGGGQVNVVAGWDGATGIASPLTMAQIFADINSYGNNGGSVFIGNGTQTTAVAIGSQSGQTNLAAFGLTVRASDTSAAGRAQLGFFGAGPNPGAITLALKDHLVLQNASATSTAMIGHGNEATSGDIYVKSRLLFSNPMSLAFQAARHIRFLADVQEGGGTLAGEGGLMNIVAGWDGATALADSFDFAAILANVGSFGNGGGSVFIDAENTSGVSVGSRFGATNVAAHDLTLLSGSGAGDYTQLGFRADQNTPNFSIDSPIRIELYGDLNVTGGTSQRTFSQVGHAGRDASEGLPNEPDGDVAGHMVINVVGNVNLVGGDALHAYAQLGHGGVNHDGARSGNITVDAGLINLTAGQVGGGSVYAQIGHGGSSSNGTSSGNISITGSDVTLLAGVALANYARIGHGSHTSTSAVSSQSGNILLDVQNLLLTGGTGANSLAHVGHGGLAPGGSTGNITVLANDVTMVGSSGDFSVALIGHFAADDASLDGDITLRAEGNLSMLAEQPDSRAARIGHGRTNDGDRSGDIDIRVAGESTLVNNVAALEGWRIGHGTNGSGAITNANVTFITGTLDYDAANATPAMQTLLNQEFAEKLLVNLAGGHVTIGSTNTNAGAAGGMLVAGAFHYDNANNLSFVSAADVLFLAGVQNSAADGGGQVNVVAGWDGTTGIASPLTIAQIFANANSFGNNAGSVFIGNGTQNTAVAIGSQSGQTNLAAFALALRSSDTSAAGRAQLGFFGAGPNPGAIQVALNDHLLVQVASLTSTAMIGHGNEATAGDIWLKQALAFNTPLNIALQATRHIRFDAGLQEGGGTQAGEGGLVNLVAGWDGATALADPFNFSLIENDLASYGNNGGSVFVNREDGTGTVGVSVGSRFGATSVAAHDLVLQAGSAIRAFAQLGYQFDQSTPNFRIDAPIRVQLHNDLLTTGGPASFTYAMVGHGGHDLTPGVEPDGDFAGDITITQARDLVFTSGQGSSAGTQLGHGGSVSVGNRFGDINIGDVRDIVFTGGGQLAHTRLGHGGNVAGGNNTGDIFIASARDLLFTGRGFSAGGADANLGHGGSNADGDQAGDITILRVRDITFTGGSIGSGSEVMLGHGGGMSDGLKTGDITIVEARDITFRAGTTSLSYAQLGHGGLRANGDISGDITILQARNLLLESATGDSKYTQLGHGGPTIANFGTRTGDIFINLLGSAELKGNGSLTPAHLGHATQTAGGVSGNLTLAIDQADPLFDGGGRLVMSNFSAISMGGAPNHVRIFDTRRDGASPWQIADGALFNGVTFRAGGTPGTINGTWTPNAEFFNWDHEQWGFTLASPGPYTGPFTLFFLNPGQFIGAQTVAQFEATTASDRFNNLGYWFSGNGGTGNSSSYGDGDEEDRDPDEITGSSSAETFQ